MKKATLVVDEFYRNNRIFNLDDLIANRDNCLYQFYRLKTKFAEHGIDLSTQDINSTMESDIVIYLEIPKELPYEDRVKDSYLIILESQIIKSDNWDLEKHDYFNKIFTWNDDYVDKKKYIKIYYAFKKLKPMDFSAIKKEKLCTMIAANKSSNDKRELYSERFLAINWFEKNHPECFDLYGYGWDRIPAILPKYKRKLAELGLFQYPKISCYKGEIATKSVILERYRFSICYENCKGFPGYITEKPFDAFFSGCVPVYLGAPNVASYLPKDTFVDKRDFATYEELYKYLTEMSEVEYTNYLKNIEKFLNSEQMELFSAENFAQTIIDNI
jgi:hypothetical protein